MQSEPAPAVTDDAVLGGRLRLLQLAKGHRVGHDAILLAAMTPAKAGEHAVDLGAGIGGAGLALAARIAGVAVSLVEIDAALADLARQNAERNGLADRVRVHRLDVRGPTEEFVRAGLADASAAHVLMNPPFNDPARHRTSPHPARRQAHVKDEATLSAWTQTAARLLAPGGTLTLIWRADELDHVLGIMSARFGGLIVLPVHGKAGQPAIRVLVRGRLGERSPLTLLPAVVLTDAQGEPTAEATAVLRRAAPLPHGGLSALQGAPMSPP